MRASLRFSSALLVLLLGAASASAVCNQTSASQADRDFWPRHGCWDAYFLWQYRAYNLREVDWNSRGWRDACNVNLEFPKHWSATVLIEYDLLDNNDQSFHGMIDYQQTAQAGAGVFHNAFFHTATDDVTVFGRFNTHFLWMDEVQTSCLLYDASSANANPGSRGGDFMHEGWHAWLRKYSWDNGSAGGHRGCVMNADGTCTLGTCSAKGCDYFYFHGISAYAFGAMWDTDGTGNRFHSPNQVQVEYLCDVSDQSRHYVPASVRQSAAADANQRAVQRFINGPGYSCGTPRPW